MVVRPDLPNHHPTERLLLRKYSFLADLLDALIADEYLLRRAVEPRRVPRTNDMGCALWDVVGSDVRERKYPRMCIRSRPGACIRLVEPVVR